MAEKRRYIKGPTPVGDISGKRQARKNSRLEQKVENLENKYKASLGGGTLSSGLDENTILLKGIFKNCSDFITRELTLGGNGPKCLVCFIDNLVNAENLNNFLLKPLMSDIRLNAPEETPAGLPGRIRGSLVYFDNIEETASLNTVVERLMRGGSALLIDGYGTALVLSIAEWKGRQVSSAMIERVVNGPHEAFVENVDTNIALLRNRIRTPDLKTEKFEIGRVSATSVIITYVSGVVNDKIVDEVRKRIKRIDVDIIVDSSYIDRYIEDETYSPFPQAVSTERPDKVTGGLAEGRVAIFVNGSPNVLVVPVTMSDFLSSAEDYYTLFYFSTFFRLLRYAAFAIALFGPSFYIAITTYHQEMIPLPLLITIARSRAEVPFPAIVEALIMEFTFELLREAGIRLPSPVGPAISIVGGLVIGQGVVQAGIVSQTMVIVVATTGIASFSLPAFNLSVSLRLIRFPIMALAAFLGLYGIVMGLLVMLIHLVSLRSFGVPYMAPLAPLFLKDLKDTMVKTPIWSIITRPSFLRSSNREKIKRGLRPKADGGS